MSGVIRGLVVCSVFDLAAQIYHPPVTFRATGAALRWFEDGIKNGDPKDPIVAHPEHFQLFHLGTFDDFSGQFSLLPAPDLLVHGSAFASAAPAKPVFSS